MRPYVLAHRKFRFEVKPNRQVVLSSLSQLVDKIMIVFRVRGAPAMMVVWPENEEAVVISQSINVQHTVSGVPTGLRQRYSHQKVGRIPSRHKTQKSVRAQTSQARYDV